MNGKITRPPGIWFAQFMNACPAGPRSAFKVRTRAASIAAACISGVGWISSSVTRRVNAFPRGECPNLHVIVQPLEEGILRLERPRWHSHGTADDIERTAGHRRWVPSESGTAERRWNLHFANAEDIFPGLECPPRQPEGIAQPLPQRPDFRGSLKA